MNANEPKAKTRKYVAVRMNSAILDRILAVAEQQHSNQRIVVEQCVAAHLPVLEAAAGLNSVPAAGAGRVPPVVAQKIVGIVRGTHTSRRILK